MKRNINLSLGLQKQATMRLSAALLLRILIAYSAILMLIWGMMWGLKWYQEIALNKVTAKQISVNEKLVALQAKYSIQDKFDEHTKYWAALVQKKRQRYSGYLHDLAVQVPQGVWLETIEIGHEGAFIKLTGKTFNSPLAMVLLQNLTAAPAFADKKFKIFDLSIVVPKDYPDKKVAGFTVQTE